MSFENYVLDAIERALAWDLEELELGRVVCSHAAALAKIQSDQDWGAWAE